MSVTKKADKAIEFYPDAMARFERAVKVVVKSPPQPKVKPKAKKAKARKKR